MQFSMQLSTRTNGFPDDLPRADNSDNQRATTTLQPLTPAAPPLEISTTSAPKTLTADSTAQISMPQTSMPQTSVPNRVLVVDDVEANLRLLTRILEGAAYTVTTASGGHEALEKAAAQTFDIVLLDVMMPDIDGFEVCERLRAQEKTRHLPIVMVTALQEVSYRVRALELGADDFLSKPLEKNEVLARVKSLVRVKRGRDELERAYLDLQRVEAQRDELSEMLVHDLRTPLTTLLMPLTMLESEQFGALNETQREVTMMAVRGGNRLLRLVNELLDISKMESGSMTLQRRAVELPTLGEEALEQVVSIQLTNQARVSFEYSNDLPMVPADADLLRRVLINLLGNAIKFTPSDGSITLGARPENDNLIVWVRDTGEGVPPEDQARIFEKFGQVESRRAGRRMSTGLGLTFCKLVVEAHGGQMWLESALGEGSTFYFSLPLGS